MEYLELAVLLNPANVQFVIERLVQPQLAMGARDVVVYPRVEILHVFRGPTADELAFGVFPPADADAGRYCAVVANIGSVSSHYDFQNRSVLEVLNDLVHRIYPAEQFFGQYRGVWNYVKIFYFCLQ